MKPTVDGARSGKRFLVNVGGMDCFCSSLVNNVLYCSVPYNDSDVSRMCDLLLLYEKCGSMQKRERLVFVVSVVV